MASVPSVRASWMRSTSAPSQLLWKVKRVTAGVREERYVEREDSMEARVS